MFNTNHCVPDEKYSQKHVYIVYFHVCKFWRGEKKNENTANAALKLNFRPAEKNPDLVC